MIARASGTPIQAQTSKPTPVVGMVAGAAIGGLCAGPIGAIVGAGIGVAASSSQRRSRLSASRPVAGTAQPAPTSSLGVTIRLPREAIQVNGGVQYFAVDVMPVQGGQSWRVLKRYNDFDHLRTFFQMQWTAYRGTNFIERSARFPRKHLMRCTGAKLEKRRRMLEAWLAANLFHNNAECVSALRNFLNIQQHGDQLRQNGALAAPIMPAVMPMASQTPVLGIPMAAAVATPPLPNSPVAAPPIQTPAAPQSTPSRPSRPISREVDSAQAPGEIMEIHIPEGVHPGQMIAITVPDGRQATLKVPAGMTAGSSLMLFFDSNAGTLSSLDQGSVEAAGKSQDQGQAEEPCTVLVEVPVGVSAGQLIAVAVPSGRHINFHVPAGAREGQLLRLWFDPVSATLVHMP